MTREHAKTWEQENAGAEEKKSPLLPCASAPVLILGLGNPLLGDDGVGWQVVDHLERQIANYQLPLDDYELDCHAGGGLSLMERLVGYDRAILIDALTTGACPIGTVQCCALEELTNPAGGHLMSSHDTSLQNAIEAGRTMDVELPTQVVVVTIEAERVYDFAEGLSPRVADAVPRAAQRVLKILRVWSRVR